MEKQPIRHGDVNLHPYEGKIEGEKVTHKGTFKLALGEVTGHSHRISTKNPTDLEIYETAFGRIVVLKSEGIISHEEHKTLTVPAGTYIQKQEREFDWFQKVSRQVID